jgi:hypothetical protein
MGMDAIDKIVVEEVELDEPGDYDVRIKVMTAPSATATSLRLPAFTVSMRAPHGRP